MGTHGKSKARGKAAKADRYALYQKSVQNPDHEVKMFRRAYREACGGREPRVLREDFCAAFAICCEWVKGKAGARRRAVGVDLDTQPLTWGREHNLAKLRPAERRRVTLLQDDVRKVAGPKADVVAAENFSYWIFKTRAELLAYFKAAYRNLAGKGVFVTDIMGGPALMKQPQKDVTKHKGFRYVWEQESFDPITHDCRFHITFRFKDKSKLKRAFTYDWRLWTIPEVSELMREAGFRDVVIYWEGTDPKTGEGNSKWTRKKSAEPEDCWITYVVGVK